jgi:ribonuclease-3
VPDPAAADLAALADRLGYRFNDLSILRQGVAHRSWCAEQPGEPSNERLEFLGDAVLGWVVADVVYRTYGRLAEGQLTDVRKAVVNAVALAEVAAELGLGSVLLLGKGEAAAGGRFKPSILSDALEAVFAAVYIDGGAAAAHELISRLLADRIALAAGQLGGLDHKTTLQELAARRFESAPVYHLAETGPDHDKRFFATVTIAGVAYGTGEGRSKKQAEQAAARAAVTALA